MKKTIIIALALAIVLINGCKKLEDFGNTNLNPAATNAPITSALLTNVLSGIGNTAWAGQALYCQYISETQYPSTSLYALNQGSPMGNYSGALYDLQNIIMNNTDPATMPVAELNGSNDDQIAIARILKAYIFWTITDRWGDVPYKDALKGDPNVAFDTQDTIYKSLMRELTQAKAQLNGSKPIKGDIVYGGDVTKWRKLANSMRMLMALRLSKVYPSSSGYAAVEFKAALADAAGSIAVNADNYKLAFPGGNFKNPFYNMYDGRNDYGESNTMTDLMTKLADVRQNAFGATIKGAASSLGVPYGWDRTSVDPWCQTNSLSYAWVLAPSKRLATSPLQVVNAASVLLARAEAADRGWTTEDAATLYVQGITASHQEWGLADPTVTYLTDSTVALPHPTGTGANLYHIARQQYIAYYPNGMQGWANWRRTGYPPLVPARDAQNTHKVIPRRYVYGTNDYSLNSKAVKEAVLRFNTTPGDTVLKDKMDSRVWWDK
jgi:hypothetical protein